MEEANDLRLPCRSHDKVANLEFVNPLRATRGGHQGGCRMARRRIKRWRRRRWRRRWRRRRWRWGGKGRPRRAHDLTFVTIVRIIPTPQESTRVADARGAAHHASFFFDCAHSRHPWKGVVVEGAAIARGEAGAPHRVLMQRVEACRGGRGVHHEESDERRRHGAQGVARHRGGGVQARNNEESRATHVPVAEFWIAGAGAFPPFREHFYTPMTKFKSKTLKRPAESDYFSASFQKSKKRSCG